MAKVDSPPDGQPSRGPGRPRKWANDAERVRAYRARKAAEQADVDQLRRDRRALRRKMADLLDKLARTQRAAETAERQIGLLTAALDKAGRTIQAKESEVRWLRQELAEAREKRRDPFPAVQRMLGQEPPPSVDAPSPAVGLSRAQRRALERKSRGR